MITLLFPRVGAALPRWFAAAISLGILHGAAVAASPAGDAAGAAAIPRGEAKAGAAESSVVKVFSSVRYPDFYQPWTKQPAQEVSGSGVIIEGRRILCNAHVVSYASQVQVQASQAGDKLSATVEAIAPGIDLAVLKLEDEAFFSSHPPLPRAKILPEIKAAVMVYGYPTGGAGLSITRGIVSRIEFAPYNFPVSGVWIQIDAAINPGNSGGPALVDNQMIGLVFSRLGGSDNIGFIIPCEEIELFLEDIKDGQYDGKPAMFDDLQTLENPALRSFLKLSKPVEGIVVHQPDSADPAYPLKEWDLITRIGDTPVDNEGLIKLGSSLRINFHYLIQKVAARGKVPLTVVRAGKEVAVDLPVSGKRPVVIPSLNGTYPSYFVYGPLVFSVATSEFVGGMIRSEYGGTWMNILMAKASPLLQRMADRPAFEGERLVVVSSPFFPHKVAKGYSNPASQVVKNVNGQRIKNLAHLVEVLRDCRDEFVTFEFSERAAETPVFVRREMLAATEEILTDNGVRSQGSPDMLAIWNAKPAR